MSIILGTEESRSFSSADGEKEMNDLIDKLEGTVSYNEYRKEDLRVGEIIDCPIIKAAHESSPVPAISYKPNTDFPGLDRASSFSLKKELDEQVVEAMGDSRLCLGIPGSTTLTPQPLAHNAVVSLVNQAIGGKSAVLSQSEEKNNARVMRVTTRAAILNECFSVRKDTCKVYMCDGMVRYVAGNNYTYLPISELIDALKSTLSVDFPGTEFLQGFVSHTYCEFRYALGSSHFEKEIGKVLSDAGISGNYRLGVIFATSNTGDSGANIYPVLFGDNGKEVFIEEPLKMEHTGSASIEQFKANVSKIMALVKCTAEHLEALAEIPVIHPEQAYRNAATTAGFPVSAYSDQAELFAATYGAMATMLDLYSELSEALAIYAAKNKMDALRKTKMLSSLSRQFLRTDNLKIIDTDVDLSKVISAA